MSTVLQAYYDLEEMAMLEGIEPQSARFLVQLGQPQAETFIPTLVLPPGEGPPPTDPSEEFGTGTGTRVPEMGTTPGSVPVRADRWDFDTKPLATYRVAPGDTLVGLARTYIHPSGVDWPLIWNAQTAEFRASHKSPDVLFAEEIIRMPKEASDNMKAFLALGEPSQQKPSELTKSQKSTAKASKIGKYALIGGGAAGALYLLYRAFA